MPRALYYASTVRNLKDVVRYFVHPLFKTVAFAHFRNADKADIAASVVGTAFYGSLTAAFQGQESDIFDKNVRTAVAAEMGKDPAEIKFSDYMDSKNSIVTRELKDLQNITKIRYATDAVFLLPAAIYAASTIFPGLKKTYQRGRIDHGGKPPKDANIAELAVGAFNLWDHLIYGTKAGYWAYETYGIPKTAHYEVVKTFENVESVGKKFTENDVLAIVNRAREDQGLGQITDKGERETLWPILTHVCDKLNHAHQFGVPELVYLIGLEKLNIFEKDAQGKEKVGTEEGTHVISQEKIQAAHEAIDMVAEKGLIGVAEENKQARMTFAGQAQMPGGESQKMNGFAGKTQTTLGGTQKNNGFVDNIRRNIMDRSFDLTTGLFPSPKKGVEYISPRDLGDVPNYMA